MGEHVAARPLRVEDRWILSRLQRTIEAVTEKLDSFDFAHAALDLYDFFWSELCDWYLEIVKPRLYDGEPEASANLLHVLGEVLALAHPIMPFVTEEVWAYMPGPPDRSPLVVSPYPTPAAALVDPEAEREVRELIDLTRSVRRWRDLVGVTAASVLPARVADGEPPHELVARLARLSFDGADGEALATIGPLEIVSTAEIDADRVRGRIDQRRSELRSEVDRAERRLANDGFVAKAPEAVVVAEREKLERYRAELEELG